MAWRPYSNLIEGVLTNEVAGKVTGWVDFYRENESPLHCSIELEGDFLDDELRGRNVRFWNDNHDDALPPDIMNVMSIEQVGEVGPIVLDYEEALLYIEWYSKNNGRVVLKVPFGVLNSEGEIIECVEVSEEEIDTSTLPPRKFNPDAFDNFMKTSVVALRKQTKDPNVTAVVIGTDGRSRSISDSEAKGN